MSNWSKNGGVKKRLVSSVPSEKLKRKNDVARHFLSFFLSFLPLRKGEIPGLDAFHYMGERGARGSGRAR